GAACRARPPLPRAAAAEGRGHNGKGRRRTGPATRPAPEDAGRRDCRRSGMVVPSGLSSLVRSGQSLLFVVRRDPKAIPYKETEESPPGGFFVAAPAPVPHHGRVTFRPPRRRTHVRTLAVYTRRRAEPRTAGAGRAEPRPRHL